MLKGYLEVACEAARAAGAVVREHFGKRIRVDLKGRINLVTEVDTRAEEAIRRVIREAYPEHRILGEEAGESGGRHSPTLWIVDPLDGTTNFAHGYPCVAISVAVEVAGQLKVGVVLDPVRGELFTALQGGGAWRNGERIQVSQCEVLDDALLVTGFPYDVRRHPRIHLALLGDFLVKSRGIRRDGAAALDLCYVACGRFDGFWELGLNPWDVAAGSLIVAEAGGMLTDFGGRPLDIRRPQVVASNARLHQAMLEVIAPHRKALAETPYGSSSVPEGPPHHDGSAGSYAGT